MVNTLAEVKRQHYPSLIKYMGSKSKIMDFVLSGINEVYKGGAVSDLFSGSGSLAGAIGQQCEVHSNDIQNYSAVLARTYNQACVVDGTPTAEALILAAQEIVNRNMDRLPSVASYADVTDLKEFDATEATERSNIDAKLDWEFHLFAKYYSGTWFSAYQCLWIDALREVAEGYKKTSIYDAILSSLMFSMAYASQGTGHYAQYRNAKDDKSMHDILIYRRREIPKYFARKYNELLDWLPKDIPALPHQATSLDFKECLSSFSGGVVYADPPYCFVHYSRFYHLLETLVLYDFPALQVQRGNIVKGRYREVRHQSPFCIKSKVKDAFTDLFEGVANSGSNLVLSYSNTGMVTVDEIEAIAASVFGTKATMKLLTVDHQHMTLGRANDRHRDVQECLILVS